MEERKYKVYIHENKVNGKKYIGITRREVQKRWGYEGSGYKNCTYFWRAIKKYGWNNFLHEVLFQNLTGKEAIELEKILIKTFKANNKNYGYNITPGGSYTGQIKESTRKKFRDLGKGRTLSDEIRRKISKHVPDRKGKNNPMYGIHLDKGRPILCLNNGIEYKSVHEIITTLNLKEGGIRAVLAKRQNSTNGYHFVYKDEYNANEYYSLSINGGKEIICTDTGEIFLSVQECAAKLGLNESSIVKVCKGKIKSTNGFHFQYWEGKQVKKTVKEKGRKMKKVKCLNNGRIYKSAREAARELQLGNNYISAICRGALKSTKGFVFEYATC